MADGGVTALSGFLYQLLGSAAVLSQAASDRLAVLQLEPSGEDALLSLASGKTLVQFKYSAAGRAIQPAELATILSKLADARIRIITEMLGSLTLCERFCDFIHFDSGEDIDFHTISLDGISECNSIDHCGQHTHVIGCHAIHALGFLR